MHEWSVSSNNWYFSQSFIEITRLISMNLSIDQLIFQNFSKGARRMPQGLIQDLLVVVGL